MHQATAVCTDERRTSASISGVFDVTVYLTVFVTAVPRSMCHVVWLLVGLARRARVGWLHSQYSAVRGAFELPRPTVSR